MKIILTYGTFDLFHIGHLNLLERLAKLGDKLIVGVSTDEFNLLKGKNSIYSYAERARIIAALSCVDSVFPEQSWEQKSTDIEKYKVTLLGMGSDWEGKFDDLNKLCQVQCLSRTENISTTDLKKSLSQINLVAINQIKSGLDSVLDIIKAIE